MSLSAATYCLVHVDDVGGDVAVLEKASLFGAAKFVSERSEDEVEE